MTSLFDMTGKVAIVTGASRGIGQAIATRFAEAGMKVVLSSRKQEGLDAVADELRAKGGDVLPVAAHNGDKAALVNLVENALRYSGGAVEIETRTQQGAVSVSVLDRGPGIPPAEAQRMLQPFTRMEASRSGASGSGLGLAIVQRIAKLHHGHIELLARAGGGLEARVTLPLRPPQA